MSYRITVTARFEAAHNLIDYAGGPEPLHGHSYRVEAVLEADKLQQYDLAVDFVPAKKALAAIASEFDYGYVNDHPPSADGTRPPRTWPDTFPKGWSPRGP